MIDQSDGGSGKPTLVVQFDSDESRRVFSEKT
jgi:hypothetical protein